MGCRDRKASSPSCRPDSFTAAFRKERAERQTASTFLRVRSLVAVALASDGISEISTPMLVKWM